MSYWWKFLILACAYVAFLGAGGFNLVGWQAPAIEMRQAFKNQVDGRLTDKGECFFKSVVNRGAEIETMADTGASAPVFDRRFLGRIGVSAAQLRFDHEVETGGGRVLMARVVVKEVRVGGFVARDVAILISNTIGVPLLGMSVMKGMKLEIDGRSCALRW